ncbi:MAG: DNA-3-methyladenine glycosylase 2 family protein [Chloroflexi bacterium]|nr:DNA-3-methyladenine glycosylase 2 family protein [Chloroflexota bacterium]
MITSPISKLNKETFQLGLRFLSRRDPDLKRITQQLGPPPMWTRKAGFATLIHLILEQQVSLASARAAMNRLCATCIPLTPIRFLELDDATLRTIGFSRQKAAYGRYLAQAIIDGQLNLRTLHRMEDAAVRAELIKLKGIGRWTADTYLLMALRRPDAFPSGDLALQVAVQKIKRLKSRPTPDQLDVIGLAWQPWRAIATRICWHYYLSGKM